MDFYANITPSIDLREELDAVLLGRADVTAQGRHVILRRMSNTTCAGCWDAVSGGSSRPSCPYCKGEGWQFTESEEIMGVYRGVAPVYKTGVLATGSYPQSNIGYTDENRATVYAPVIRQDGNETYPNYERYTLQTAKNYDKLYELKVDVNGDIARDPVSGRYIRTIKWKVLSVVPMHGDNGRIEFFVLDCEKENL